MIQEVMETLTNTKIEKKAKLMDRVRLSTKKYDTVLDFYKTELIYTNGRESTSIKSKIKQLKVQDERRMYSYCYRFYNDTQVSDSQSKAFCMTNADVYSFFKNLTTLDYIETRKIITDLVKTDTI